MRFGILKPSILQPLIRTMSSSTEDVLFSKVGTSGIITLNRPKALNALNLNMVELILPKLMEWRDDTSISHVIIRGSGEKAFCAGGDIRAVTERSEKGENLRRNFFKKEYHLNYTIGTMKKPYIALINGITMGGGVGLSVHGRYRVATEKTVFAMPETAIGLFPDVGGGYFLPRLRGQLGLFLALTGHRLKGADVTKAGIATHFVDQDKLDVLVDTLTSLQNVSYEEVENVLRNFQDSSAFNPTTEFSLKDRMKLIDHHFQYDSIEEIISSLKSEAANCQWCSKMVETLSKMSPTSMKITLRLLREGKTLSLVDVLRIEYRLAQRCGEDHDFFEGVRAVLIDRDNNPKWNPATVEGMTQDKVQWYFSMLEPDREWEPV